MKHFIRQRFCIVPTLLMLAASVAAESVEPSFQDNAKTLDGVISAYYEVVSGPKGFEYNPERDSFLHARNAMITRFNEKGDFQRHTLLDEQKSLEEPYAEGFFEVEVNRIVEEYGGIAHVWSTYEIRESPNGKAFARGINSISLYFKDDRWWISSWSTQTEDTREIPDKYLPGPGHAS
ncbi:hypothetical protein EY643_08820 [Halioglobus maricola]|uniref:Nuclear transport factor 2 family protein n=1 Tax=Halioglobus maricola TaxID=2601894 RepID=A0A5P9NIT3_9GAMM|nr:hypothetical protein [Halioglobus maricola]QFU75750.1 hypothetical protein EY643_08820 [Halioglobus maricola]